MSDDIHEGGTACHYLEGPSDAMCYRDSAGTTWIVPNQVTTISPTYSSTTQLNPTPEPTHMDGFFQVIGFFAFVALCIGTIIGAVYIVKTVLDNDQELWNLKHEVRKLDAALKAKTTTKRKS